MTELTIDQALQQGVEAHKAGQVQEADRLYTAILKAQPKHPDANHNMGVLAVGVGKVQEALPLFKTALEANPSIGQFWLSYIDALIKLGKLADAKAVLDQAKSKGAKGNSFDKIEKKIDAGANIKARNVACDQVTELHRTALQDQVTSIMKLYNDNEFNQVIKQAHDLVEQNPELYLIWNILGVAAARIKNLDQAVIAFKKATDIKPDFAEAYFSLGSALTEQGELEMAITAYKKALAIDPDNAETYRKIGDAFKEQDQLDEAIKSYNKALAVKPEDAATYSEMGRTLRLQGEFEKASWAFSKALSLEPHDTNTILSTLELLKTYTPSSTKTNNLFKIDEKVRKSFQQITWNAKTGKICDNLTEIFEYISTDGPIFNTPLSQIYKRNSIDLNCSRHFNIFNTEHIIPEFCFGCYKVQVEVKTFIDLIKLTRLFYQMDFGDDLTSKTFIEVRPNISGFYKGLVYCRGCTQAEDVKRILDKKLGSGELSQIKRGCSEFAIEFPEYGNITGGPNSSMKYQDGWKHLETKFDEKETIKPVVDLKPSIPDFCLSDFYVIQKWLDYARGIEDPTVEFFDHIPIKYNDIFILANHRAKDTLAAKQAINLVRETARSVSKDQDAHKSKPTMGTLRTDDKVDDEFEVQSNQFINSEMQKNDPPQAKQQAVKNLYNQGQLQSALARADRLLRIYPNSSEIHSIRGAILNGLGQFDASIESYKVVITIEPNNAKAHTNIGVNFQDQGELDKAMAAYKKALTIKPDFAEAHRFLSVLFKYKSGNSQIRDVENLLKRHELKDQDRSLLHFTYAKMMEDLKDFKLAFESLTAAGKLQQKIFNYDFAQDQLEFERIKNTAPKFKRFAVKTFQKTGHLRPIFIVGMLRSGTSLVEQIVSSHTEITGAGELPYISQLGRGLALGRVPPSSSSIQNFRVQYLARLAEKADGKSLVTDKMPRNFRYIGLICAAFPEAKIIHVKRDAAATCWSNFKHYFSDAGNGFSYNLKDTVNYYLLYKDLMRFWDPTFNNMIYNLDYDRLTENQEHETRQLIKYLDIEWQYQCLEPQNNKRVVKTASQQQVRQKIYKGSSQAWEKFEPFLDGIFNRLVADIPAEE